MGSGGHESAGGGPTGGNAGTTPVPEKIAELTRSNAELEAFAQHIAHDLREPLRSIKLVTQFLREDLEGLDETTAARLVKLGDIATRGERLIGALLEFARAGQAGLSQAEHDPAEIARDAAETLAAAIAENRAEVVIPGSLPLIRCDRTLIGHVFVHLIGNGLKYNKSEHKRVEIGAGGTPSAPAIFVRDNGTGINPRDLDAVFGMFTRRHAREDFPAGSGAGLAIARRIIERHGGKIWIESKIGAGTTVWFTLAPGAGPGIG